MGMVSVYFLKDHEGAETENADRLYVCGADKYEKEPHIPYCPENSSNCKEGFYQNSEWAIIIQFGSRRKCEKCAGAVWEYKNHHNNEEQL